MLKKQLAKIGAVTVCPAAIIVKDGAILMGYRHYTADIWKDISVWTSPGGRCDAGETLEQALRREVQEETGITDLRIREYLGEAAGGKASDGVIFSVIVQQNRKTGKKQLLSIYPQQ